MVLSKFFTGEIEKSELELLLKEEILKQLPAAIIENIIYCQEKVIVVTSLGNIYITIDSEELTIKE